MAIVFHTDIQESGVARSKRLVEITTFFHRRGQMQTPLSLMLVNAHVLTEIVLATEGLIAARERARKRWLQCVELVITVSISFEHGKIKPTFFVGMDATNVSLEMFTPGETLSAISYDADEGPSSLI